MSKNKSNFWLGLLAGIAGVSLYMYKKHPKLVKKELKKIKDKIDPTLKEFDFDLDKIISTVSEVAKSINRGGVKGVTNLDSFIGLFSQEKTQRSHNKSRKSTRARTHYSKNKQQGALQPKDLKVLKALSKKKGITQKELSTKTKIPYRTIRRIVNRLVENNLAYKKGVSRDLRIYRK